MPNKILYTAQVEVAVKVDEGTTEDDIDNLIHGVFAAGDPDDALNAALWVKEVELTREA